MTHANVPADSTWRKSSYSNGGDNCIEVLDGVAAGVPVRDSKDPSVGSFLVGPEAWTAFVESAKQTSTV